MPSIHRQLQPPSRYTPRYNQHPGLQRTRIEMPRLQGRRITVRNDRANETGCRACYDFLNSPTCIKIAFATVFGGSGGAFLGTSFLHGESDSISAGLRWTGVALLSIGIITIAAMCWGTDDDDEP